PQKRPTVLLCIGMAGSGKTTFMQRLNAHLHSVKKPPYVLNLDPAVSQLPFTANIDIRDTVNYKEVMKQYNLGPNGGILTSLNLFTTKFDQVLEFISKRAPTLEHIIVDTPGQIEIFTWSASGAIITDAMAATYPCAVAYVIDTPRTTSPATFMIKWMTDFETFQQALQKDSSYMSSLMNSMCLVVGVSAITGAGMDEFFKAVDEAVKEYETVYKPELEKLIQKKAERQEDKKQAQLTKLMKDMDVSDSSSKADIPVFFRDYHMSAAQGKPYHRDFKLIA
ncbi:3093_t:CDS:2, partial [Gigaspora rosea]